MAGGPGFEPELPGPEPGVLPLNYPPTCKTIMPIFAIIVIRFLLLNKIAKNIVKKKRFINLIVLRWQQMKRKYFVD